MEPTIAELLAGGGPVAILAYLIFWMYRKDKKDNETRINNIHKAHSDRLAALLKDYHTTMRKNTKALTELVTMLRKMNGKR